MKDHKFALYIKSYNQGEQKFTHASEIKIEKKLFHFNLKLKSINSLIYDSIYSLVV